MKYTASGKFDLDSVSRMEAVNELLELFNFGKQTMNLLAGALEVREQVGATVVQGGISLPHCRSILVDRLFVAVGRSRKGIPWPEEPVHTVILFISPVKPNGPEEHSAFLSHIADHLKKSANDLTDASSMEMLFDLLGLKFEDMGG